MEPKPTYKVARDTLIERLFNVLQDEDVAQLLDEVERIIGGTGYGLVHIEMKGGIPFLLGGMEYRRISCK